MSEIPYICVLDFEATCDNEQKWSHEIIEFPSVMLKWNEQEHKFQKIGEFQEYCKPLQRPEVTKFCYDLTGISQETVDNGNNFPETYSRHWGWVCSLVPTVENDLTSVVLLTCGHWDMKTMMLTECKRWHMLPNTFYRRYINIKDVYYNTNLAATGEKSLGMAGMLKHANLELLGRHHSGIDDCRNTARLVQKLVEDGHIWSEKDINIVSKEDYVLSQDQKKSSKFKRREQEIQNRLSI